MTPFSSSKTKPSLWHSAKEPDKGIQGFACFKVDGVVIRHPSTLARDGRFANFCDDG